MIKESLEKTKNRSKEYRDRMKRKGFKYLTCWVPQKNIEQIRSIIEKFIEEEKFGESRN